MVKIIENHDNPANTYVHSEYNTRHQLKIKQGRGSFE